MSHIGCLNDQNLSSGSGDVRGTTVRGSDNTDLGTVEDVIFDHDTMEIRYIVLNTAGELDAGTFLIPAERVTAGENREDGLTAAVTRKQIENSPQFANENRRADVDWKKYEQEFKKYWEEEPVMHMKDSYRIITPTAPPSQGSQSTSTALNAANLFPERLSDPFADPAPNPSKVTLRPKPAAQVEEAAARSNIPKPRWWEAFENYLNLNKSEIQTHCSHCAPKAA